MKLNFTLIVLFALLFVTHISIFACTCADISQRERFRRSNSVFLGEVIEIKDSSEQNENLKYLFYSVKFKVEKKWKGKKSKEISVLADNDTPEMCGDLGLKVGRKFLIYSVKSFGKLVVNQDCPLSRNAEYAKAEITNLDNFLFRIYSFVYPFPKF